MGPKAHNNTEELTGNWQKPVTKGPGYGPYGAI